LPPWDLRSVRQILSPTTRLRPPLHLPMTAAVDRSLQGLAVVDVEDLGDGLPRDGGLVHRPLLAPGAGSVSALVAQYSLQKFILNTMKIS
jgi:hypothetical protein